MIQPGSLLWQYLSHTQRELATDGELLVDDRARHPNEKINDYSYLVFPFAKLYEGFLKQLLRDLGIIEERDYVSTHFRLGKVLSPHLVRRLGKKSAYQAIAFRYNEPLADTIWRTWKQGRNLVFHYFPHNVRKLSFEDAKQLIQMICDTMEQVVDRTRPKP